MDFQKFLFTCLTLEWAEKEASGGRKFNLTVHSSTWPPPPAWRGWRWWWCWRCWGWWCWRCRMMLTMKMVMMEEMILVMIFLNKQNNLFLSICLITHIWQLHWWKYASLNQLIIHICVSKSFCWNTRLMAHDGAALDVPWSGGTSGTNHQYSGGTSGTSHKWWSKFPGLVCGTSQPPSGAVVVKLNLRANCTGGHQGPCAQM